MILGYVENFYEWPEAWMGEDIDLAVGEEIIKAFEPFFVHLIEQGYTKKTIKKHANNLWLLGGEIVRYVSTLDEYDKDIIKMTENFVDVEGGPLCRHLETEKEISAFDGTCRKFYHYLKARRDEKSR